MPRGSFRNDQHSWVFVRLDARMRPARPGGEIGRRTRFRFWRSNTWGFESLPGHHGKKQALDFQGPFLCTVLPFVLRSEAMGEGSVLGQVPSSRTAYDAKAPKSPDYACVCLVKRAEKTGASLLAPVSGVGHTICLIQPRRMASKNSALPLVDLTLSSRNSIASRSSIG